MAPQAIAHYRITSKLGQGGMGEVYRATDTKLGREVAIKVLPEAFAQDGERLARFTREAHLLASLNHPNIAAIYGLEDRALVMELVEGPTLLERIKGGALLLDEALIIARQIGDALEAAHEKGIVHRDLKPANVKVKPDGTVKVLDFGLAKFAEPATPAENPEDSPTLTIEATRVRQILGTAAYMAPEQARGQAVDKRADIWAFGVVLYEMLTGRRLFQGETTSDTLAAVLKAEPEWERVPAKAQRLLKSCLEKDPKRRLRDIGDAWGSLEDAPQASPSRSRLGWVVAGALAATLAVVVALWPPWRSATRPIEQPSTRLDLDLGSDVSLGSAFGPSVILSPDGTRIVFVSPGKDEVRRLFTRRLDQPKATQLGGTEGAYAPFFSPDGQSVGFFALGKLKKTRIDGGEPVSLCDAPAGRGGSWGEDGTIIAALDGQVGLSQVQTESGTPSPLTELEVGEVSHRWPQVLPGNKAVLFTAGTGYGNYSLAGIAVVTLADHRKKLVMEHAGMYPRYLPSGHLVYVAKGGLFASPFDLQRYEVRGAAARLQEVADDLNSGAAEIDVSRTGTIAYRSGRTERLRTVQWLDAAGNSEPLSPDPAFYMFPRLSPDGNRLVLRVTQGSGTDDPWIYDLQRGPKTRLTSGTGLESWPVWSPDGQYVVFESTGGMFWARADGAGNPKALTQSKKLQFPSSFSPDGKWLAFSELTSSAMTEIRTLRVENAAGQLRTGESEPFLKTSSGQGYAAFSPDGRWLAYADSPAGNYEV